MLWKWNCGEERRGEWLGLGFIIVWVLRIVDFRYLGADSTRYVTAYSECHCLRVRVVILAVTKPSYGGFAGRDGQRNCLPRKSP